MGNKKSLNVPGKKTSVQVLQKENAWRLAWSQPAFRKKLGVTFALNITVVILLPAFFQHIEQRNGMQLNDILLSNIPAINVSLPIFIIIWSTALLTFFRATRQPEILITFLFSFFLLSILRIGSITLVPLNPPKDLIPLVDPLTNTFYGGSFISKDLFFSGHVATQVLMCLCLKKRMDKLLTAISALSVGILVLLQHVHYTIDIIAAPFVTYFCFIAGRSIAKKG